LVLASKLLSIGLEDEAADPESTGAIAKSGSLGLAKTASSIAAARILVVEDQDYLREFMRAALAKAGYDVAVNGAERLTRFVEQISILSR
jgi:PleD family two-component response regulator